ncbi:DUF1338 domain-containing protein [Aliidiomarina maris]|uniref:2-oxoadipate dioxygenase/decarboxylase n=1 Tax=Aliidiomarina maris TaxID=531312 RepID=A0A327X130_9GAMM|nr:DUF1338 domain-containing protein [Aliidiomarina maris]MBA3988195.1 DUF1338 domain-containing protein [Idiomarina sp.]MCL5050568.1 DUF1338 domain-containing protein [Bacillota bacterium]RAJ98898.1 uncharacterized protein DUF1338 [Aliidiomarina maris]RUO25043.1 DUF1338 domain-containing protein [Aliidiomarina maris]
MSQQVEQFFEHLWQDYLQKTPSAGKVHQVLGGGAEIINDHVAFRTFNIAPVKLEKLAELFENMGYFANGDYHFEAKKLRAKHYEHDNKDLPKIFISELLVEEFPDDVQQIIVDMVASIDPKAVEQAEFLYSGTHWQVTKAQYDRLLEESEYAAWMSAFGFCANHFTVSVNRLPGYDSVEQVNQKLKDEGFVLNSAGGEVKGNPDVFLEQSSTMADRIDVAFADQSAQIPSCFYEFAKRYNMPDGELYTGFVAASADKIFESTNAKG